MDSKGLGRDTFSYFLDEYMIVGPQLTNVNSPSTFRESKGGAKHKLYYYTFFRYYIEDTSTGYLTLRRPNNLPILPVFPKTCLTKKGHTLEK